MNSANSADSATPTDRLRNLCGRAHETYDEAGLHRVTDYTLTGEPKRTERRLFTLAPPPAITPPVLELDTFASVSTYDPRGLRLTHKAPDGTTRRTTHDDISILESWTSHIHFAERRVALTHRWTQDSLARETDPTHTLAPTKALTPR